MTLARLCTVYAFAIAGAWILTWIMLQAINAVVRILPKVRRRVRPWMRDHGINLLPPRRKRRRAASTQRSDDEQILTFNAAQVLGKDRDQKT